MVGYIIHHFFCNPFYMKYINLILYYDMGYKLIFYIFILQNNFFYYKLNFFLKKKFFLNIYKIILIYDI